MGLGSLVKEPEGKKSGAFSLFEELQQNNERKREIFILM